MILQRLHYNTIHICQDDYWVYSSGLLRCYVICGHWYDITRLESNPKGKSSIGYFYIEIEAGHIRIQEAVKDCAGDILVKTKFSQVKTLLPGKSNEAFVHKLQHAFDFFDIVEKSKFLTQFTSILILTC